MSVCVGAIWRYARKLASFPPRIIHGIAPLHSLRESVLADRCVGIDAKSVVLYSRQTSSYDLTTAKEFDVAFSGSQVESAGMQWTCLRYLLLHADIWSSSFCLIWPAQYVRTNRWALRLLYLSGVRIIAYPYGTDAAGRDRCSDRFDWIGAIQKDYPSWDMVEHYSNIKHVIKLFCEYASLVVGMDGSVRRFLPRNDIYCKTIPVDTEKLKPLEGFRGNSVPVIVHAPNHRHVKGTQFLLDALQICRDAGINYELRLVEKVARTEALELYKTADIVADQFLMGAYGVFALECLALGKPVMTYLDHDCLSNPVFSLPIVNTNRWNLTTILAVLLLVPELRKRLGHAGRDAVVRYQSLKAIGELNTAMYDHVWWGRPLELEKTAHFGVERQSRSYSENPRDPEFWPVRVDDIFDQILAACDQIVLASSAGPIPEARNSVEC